MLFAWPYPVAVEIVLQLLFAHAVSFSITIAGDAVAWQSPVVHHGLNGTHAEAEFFGDLRGR